MVAITPHRGKNVVTVTMVYSANCYYTLFYKKSYYIIVIAYDSCSRKHEYIVYFTKNVETVVASAHIILSVLNVNSGN